MGVCLKCSYTCRNFWKNAAKKEKKKDNCVFSPGEDRGVVFGAFCVIFHFIHFSFFSHKYTLLLQFEKRKKKHLRLLRNREILRAGQMQHF